MIRVRACIKCKQFVYVKPSDPQNLNLIKVFDKFHATHTLVTLDYEEIKGQFVLYPGAGSLENQNSQEQS